MDGLLKIFTKVNYFRRITKGTWDLFEIFRKSVQEYSSEFRSSEWELLLQKPSCVQGLALKNLLFCRIR